MDLIYFDYYVGIGLRGCKIMYVWDKGLFCLFYWKNEYNVNVYKYRRFMGKIVYLNSS